MSLTPAEIAAEVAVSPRTQRQVTRSTSRLPHLRDDLVQGLWERLSDAARRSPLTGAELRAHLEALVPTMIGRIRHRLLADDNAATGRASRWTSRSEASEVAHGAESTGTPSLDGGSPVAMASWACSSTWEDQQVIDAADATRSLCEHLDGLAVAVLRARLEAPKHLSRAKLAQHLGVSERQVASAQARIRRAADELGLVA